MVIDNPIDIKIDRVTIYIPNYKNYELLIACVNSCLNQTYRNIKVVIVDNAYSEEGGAIVSGLEILEDPRIHYIPNASNIGSQGSFNLIINTLTVNSDWCIVIPADVLLVVDAVEKMMSIAKLNPRVNAVYGKTISRKVGEDELLNKITANDQSLTMPYENFGLKSSKDIINYFFDNHNLDSEWRHFSFVGALIDSAIYKSMNSVRYPMYDHGTEEYISLAICAYTDKIAILQDATLIHYANAKRFGSAVRPKFNYTRYEPLYAEYHFLREFQPLLIRKGMSLSKMYWQVTKKTIYTFAKYPGPVYLLLPQLIIAVFNLPLYLIIDRFFLKQHINQQF